MKASCLVKWCAAFLLLAGPVVLAGPRAGSYQTYQSGDWATLSSWEVYEKGTGWRAPTEDEGVPGAESYVTIRAGHEVRVVGGNDVGYLTIERGNESVGPGSLEITSGAELTVHVALKMPQRPRETEPGRILFTGSGETPGTLASEGDLAIAGDVEVIGTSGGVIRTRDGSQDIAIGRFANVRAVGGPLTLTGMVEMDGTLVADGASSVIVNGEGIGSGSSGTWRVTHPRARIEFDTVRVISLNAGRIHVERGELDVAVDMKTLGSVTTGPDARVTVRPGTSFDAPRSIESMRVSRDRAERR